MICIVKYTHIRTQMAMGPGVAIEYCGLKRVDTSASGVASSALSARRRQGSSGSQQNVVYLWVVIVLLLAIILSGTTLEDMLKFL